MVRNSQVHCYMEVERLVDLKYIPPAIYVNSHLKRPLKTPLSERHQIRQSLQSPPAPS